MSQSTVVGTDISVLDRLPVSATGLGSPQREPCGSTCQGGVTCYPSCWVTRRA
jgi:hypothetical protein